MKADFSQNIYDDESNSISTCYTHVKGLKCEMRIDGNFILSQFSRVEHRLWRKEYFPKVAFSLFTRYVKDADSQLCSQEFKNGEVEERKEETYCQFDIQEQREPAVVSTTGIPMLTSIPIIQCPDQRSEQSS